MGYIIQKPVVNANGNQIDAGCGCRDAVQNYQLSLTLSDCRGQYCVGWCVYKTTGWQEYSTNCVISNPKTMFDKALDIFEGKAKGEQYINKAVASMAVSNVYFENKDETSEKMVSVNLDFVGQGLISYDYVLLDMFGNQVKKAGGVSAVNNTKISIIEASNIDSGIYNLVLSSNGSTYSRNVVLQ